MVYENCKIYGPYLGKDKRLRIIVKFSDGIKTTVSYPKYLMEVHLDRYLEKNETVDHIDSDPLNNDISNLQILDRKVHCANDAIRVKDVTITYQYCGKEFTIEDQNLKIEIEKTNISPDISVLGLVGENTVLKYKMEESVPQLLTRLFQSTIGERVHRMKILM